MHSLPALVDRAYWNGAVAISNARSICWVMVLATNLSSDQPAHHLEGVVRARNRLEDVGFNAPSWEALADGVRPEANSLDDAGLGMPQHGWRQ